MIIQQKEAKRNDGGMMFVNLFIMNGNVPVTWYGELKEDIIFAPVMPAQPGKKPPKPKFEIRAPAGSALHKAATEGNARYNQLHMENCKRWDQDPDTFVTGPLLKPEKM